MAKKPSDESAMIKLFSLKDANANSSQGGKHQKKSSAAQLRIAKDMNEMQLPTTCELDTPDPNDMLNFNLTICPDEGYYRGGRFVFSFSVGPDYPHTPPKVKCNTSVYHPNIDTDGNVCLNILREDWKPVLTINAIVYGLQYLFLCHFGMSKLTRLFSEENELRIHTGNINSWGALKVKRFGNSSEELFECLKLQLQEWKPAANGLDTGNSVCLCVNPYKAVHSGDDRSDLKITLKVFMTAPDPQQVQQCIDVTVNTLHIDSVDRIILSLPDLDLEEVEDEEKESAELLEHIKPIWTKLEDIVHDSDDTELGIADLDVHFLQALYDWAPHVKPSINHYSIAACCTVPPELTKFAHDNDIQLLTHNDPKPLLSNEQLHQLCQDDLNVELSCCEEWRVKWVGRYTVMIRSRSVITGKGYVVCLEKQANVTK